MKTKLFLLAMALMMSNLLFAQEQKVIKIANYNLTTVTICSGKGALTSGLDTRFDFSNDKKGVLFLQANSDRATINFGKKFGNFQAIESFGVFKNIPWTGPMFLYQLGPLDFIAWNGFGFGKNDQLKDPGYEPHFFFSYEGIGLTLLKNNRFSGAIMYFTTEPMDWFLSYKRTIPVGERSNLFAEVTYGHSADLLMLVIGYSLKLKN